MDDAKDRKPGPESEDARAREARAEEVFADALARIEDGARPDVEALVRAHADLADELRALAEQHARVEAALGIPRGGTIDIDDPGAEGEALGPFLEELKKPRTPGEAFERGEFVDAGGMGRIYLGHQPRLRRNVVLKVVRGEHGERDKPTDSKVTGWRAARFLEEAQITAQLDHPGIVPVYDIGVDEDGRLFFAMKRVKGRDLGAVLAEKRRGEGDWSETRLVSLLLRACEAVAFAHDKGVIHRDIKPSNIMVGRFGEVYVMDWGLARILGREDHRDLRIRPAGETVVTSERSDLMGTPGSPLLTVDGQQLGTPAYMPPEQALGRNAELTPQSDVYAMGAVLYEVLAGHPPYVPAGAQVHPYAILARVEEGPPTPLAKEAPDAPAALVAICEKAMARDPSERYPGMVDLARDLRAYVEGRVVEAYETGAWAELKSWVRRNRGLAATAAAAVLAVLAFSGWALVERQRARSNEQAARAKEQEAREEKARADRNAEEARRNANEARQNAEQAQRNAEEARANASRAEARKAEFDQLAGVVLLRDLRAREQELYPAWPEKTAAMEEWLQDWSELEGLMPKVESTLAELESRALPWTEEERQHDRETHPRYAELVRLRSKVEWMRRAQAVRSGERALEVPELPEELRDADAKALNAYAWPRVKPEEEGRVYGEEALALRAIEEALKRFAVGDDSDHEHDLLNRKSWALFANGLDAEALAAADEALARAREEHPDDERVHKSYEGQRADLEGLIAGFAAALSEAESSLTSLESEVSRRRTWRFGTESERFLYDTLTRLREDVTGFGEKEVASVKRRLDWSRRIEGLTLRHPNARVTWEEAAAAIARADGVTASELYREHPIALKPQRGLVPIGMNPVTRLWEFYHLRSACDLASGEDPAAVEIPVHREDGTIEVKDSTGIVFVLIPGGTFWQGAQKRDEDGPNYDPDAGDMESPVQRVTLSPFFLARHEVTQGQWRRLTGETPSYLGPHNYSTDWNAKGLKAGWTHPVEMVSWEDCDLWLVRHGLLLPTECQWEYGARAGTDTPWWTGREVGDLDEAGNVADEYARNHGGPAVWRYEPLLDDGNTVHARVGSYRFNGFGLYDTIGNVWEWCRDVYGPYSKAPRAGDGLREHVVDGAANRVIRGGSFAHPAAYARAAIRDGSAPGFRDSYLGARPARVLQP